MCGKRQGEVNAENTESSHAALKNEKDEEPLPENGEASSTLLAADETEYFCADMIRINKAEYIQKRK